MQAQTWRYSVAGLALMALLVLGLVTVPVPFVAVGRGPTFDTLGDVDGVAVVTINNLPSYPTAGRLNMTTVSVTDGITGLQALGYWASADRRLVPRSALLQPGETAADAQARNERLFLDSQETAEAAALSYLGIPVAVVVGEVLANSPATDVLRAGDVLAQVAGRPVTSIAALRAALADTAPGRPVSLGIRRGDQPQADLTMTLGANPATGEAFLGILPVARPLRDEVVFALGDVGGPSAGLMFALATVDKLTPGALAGGLFVAGTGTIDSAGAVGMIEGISFKMAAAREAGATVFLVPGANCEAARSSAPEGLRLVRVDDLPGAVGALDTLRANGTPPTC